MEGTGMNQNDAFREAIQKNIDGIGESDSFCCFYHPNMELFKEDPWPAIQLAIAILMNKPIIVACIPGRVPPKKLLDIADAVVYAELADMARGIHDAMERLEKKP
jgi:hypothetical protein